MLSDDDYQQIKVSTLTAADTAARVVSSNQTVYYDEESYARVYEAMTMLRHHLCVVYSELDLFRAMFREQISSVMKGIGDGDNAGSEPSDARDPVEPAPAGRDDQRVEQAVGDREAIAANAVAGDGAEPQPKVKRPYRRRNKAAVPTVPPEVGSGDGGSEVGGQAEG